MAPTQEYTPLPNTIEGKDYLKSDSSDWEESLAGPSGPKRWPRLPLLLAFLCGLLVGIGGTCVSKPIISAVSRGLEGHGADSSVQIPESQDVNEFWGLVHEPAASDPICGNDRHEAEANGCRYDLMASRWYPEECYHGEVLEQMLEEVYFDWYWDPEHTKVATLETALSGDYDKLWPLYDFHIIHCLYQWRRLHMAVIEHRQIDDDVYSYTHTLHCTRMIMNWPNEWKYGKNTTTLSTSGVSYCIPAFL